MYQIVIILISMVVIFFLPYLFVKCLEPKAKFNQNMAVTGFILAALYFFNLGVWVRVVY